MNGGALMMLVVIAITLGVLGFLMFSMLRSIQTQRSGRKSVWREFGLGLGLMILFFVSWIAHAIAEWQVFTDSQHEHGQPAAIGDFMSQFAQSTLENWQSEFLQLFAFVVLAALFVHRGSAESKDSDEEIQASLRRIETELGTLPKKAKSSTS
jgi:hypothetical protein